MAKKNRNNTLFFALVVDGREIAPRRVPVSRLVQGELSSLFSYQKDEFLSDKELIPYQPGYKLDSDEIFRIDDFELLPTLRDAVQKPDLCPEIDGDELEVMAVRALVASKQSEDSLELLFQKVDARQVLTRKRTLLIFDGVFDHPQNGGLAIGSSLAAVFEAGRLVFDSDYFVKRFLDLSDAYGSATDSQVRKFLKSTLLKIPTGVDLVSSFDKTMRSRVAWILRDGTLSKHSAQDIKKIAAKYHITAQISGGQIELPSDRKQLKAFVKLLVDEYYEADLSGIQYQTNSKRKIQ